MVSIGMNSMGAHYNPVAISIVNSESKEAIKVHTTLCARDCIHYYTMYNSGSLCQDPACGFCTHLFKQISEPGALRKRQTMLLTCTFSWTSSRATVRLSSFRGPERSSVMMS
jgi:hypothetical protein